MVTMRLSTISASAVAATVMGFLAAAPVQASPVISVSGPFDGGIEGDALTGYLGAKAAEAAFIAGWTPGFTLTTETFETLPVTPLAGLPFIDTSVGRFTQVTQGQLNAGLRILQGNQTPNFSGRRDMTAPGFTTEDANSGRWLDSNDSKLVEWELDLAKASTAIGFFLTDINDVSASMVLSFLDGTQTEVALTDLPGENGNLSNGQVVYVTADFGSSLVEKIKFVVDTANDGWGIDNITAVAPVPLPVGAWFMLTAVAGFVGYGKMRRKVATA